jgi:NAD-dependent protein deacetylases, SIR2 family
MEELKKLRSLIEQSERIVFFGGAGVSTESGIPDFRSDQGVFKAMERFGHSPEELLSIGFFRRNPTVFYEYYKSLMVCPDAQPNKAHLALARLEQAGKLTAVVTQNIDGLHQMAGSKHVLELHGSMLRNHCCDCRRAFSMDEILAMEGVPHCGCGGVIRPDIVMYGEQLDDTVVTAAIGHIRQADLLLVGGTSLVVYPAAGLISYFGGNDLVLINKSETKYDSSASLVIHEAIGWVLGEVVE